MMGGASERQLSFISKCTKHFCRGGMHSFLSSFIQPSMAADCQGQTGFPPPWRFHMTEDTGRDQHPSPSSCQKDALFVQPPPHPPHPVCLIKTMEVLSLGGPQREMKQARLEQAKGSCEHRVSYLQHDLHLVYFHKTPQVG